MKNRTSHFLVSICVISADRFWVRNFIEKHTAFLQTSCIQFNFLITEYCSVEFFPLGLSLSETTEMSVYRPKNNVKALVMRNFLSSNENRNILLEQCDSEMCMFMDDDCEFDCDVGAFLKVVLKKKWAVFSIKYYSFDYSRTKKPVAVTSLRMGTSIEWNQIFRKDSLTKVGGWDPEFGAGATWPSGECFLIVNKLVDSGYSQVAAPEIIIRHPAQKPLSFGEIPKFLRYRYALGAASVSCIKMRSIYFWFAFYFKSLILINLKSITSLMKLDLSGAVFYIFCPWMILLGIVHYAISQKR